MKLSLTITALSCGLVAAHPRYAYPFAAGYNSTTIENAPYGTGTGLVNGTSYPSNSTAWGAAMTSANFTTAVNVTKCGCTKALATTTMYVFAPGQASFSPITTGAGGSSTSSSGDTYYYSIVNGTTAWRNGIPPPTTAYSSTIFLTSTVWPVETSTANITVTATVQNTVTSILTGSQGLSSSLRTETIILTQTSFITTHVTLSPSVTGVQSTQIPTATTITNVVSASLSTTAVSSNGQSSVSTATVITSSSANMEGSGVTTSSSTESQETVIVTSRTLTVTSSQSVVSVSVSQAVTPPMSQTTSPSAAQSSLSSRESRQTVIVTSSRTLTTTRENSTVWTTSALGIGQSSIPVSGSSISAPWANTTTSTVSSSITIPLPETTTSSVLSLTPSVIATASNGSTVVQSLSLSVFTSANATATSSEETVIVTSSRTWTVTGTSWSGTRYSTFIPSNETTVSSSSITPVPIWSNSTTSTSWSTVETIVVASSQTWLITSTGASWLPVTSVVANGTTDVASPTPVAVSWLNTTSWPPSAATNAISGSAKATSSSIGTVSWPWLSTGTTTSPSSETMITIESSHTFNISSSEPTLTTSLIDHGTSSHESALPETTTSSGFELPSQNTTSSSYPTMQPSSTEGITYTGIGSVTTVATGNVAASVGFTAPTTVTVTEATETISFTKSIQAPCDTSSTSGVNSTLANVVLTTSSSEALSTLFSINTLNTRGMPADSFSKSHCTNHGPHTHSTTANIISGGRISIDSGILPPFWPRTSSRSIAINSDVLPPFPTTSTRHFTINSGILPPLSIWKTTLDSSTLANGIGQQSSPGLSAAPTKTTPQPAYGALPPSPIASSGNNGTKCGEVGAFVVNWDDEPLYVQESANDPPFAPVFNPYHHLFWARGFEYYAPNYSLTHPSVFDPVSGPNVAIYKVDPSVNINNADQKIDNMLPGAIGAGPRAADTAYWFNVSSAELGCDNGGTSPCNMTISGYKWNAATKQEEKFITQYASIAACNNLQDCMLQRVDMEGFTGLSSVRFEAIVDGATLKSWVMDNLSMAWYDNSCEAGIKRISGKKK